MTTTAAPARRLDATALRMDFPIFDRLIHGKPLAYLDNTATTQKPLVVLKALDDFYRNRNANVHRGVYLLAEKATAAYEGAREKVARFLNARSAREVVFTRDTTESVNLVAYAWGRANVSRGDAILVTEMEHHSNLVPWQILAEEKGAELRYIPLDGQGRLDLSNLDRLLDGRVKLAAFTWVSNALGTINPVAELVRRAHAAGALAFVDAAQAVPHMPVDFRALDADFLAFSGHKVFAPTGIGALLAKRPILDAMPPFFGGGEMIREVTMQKSTWADVPAKFEAGTMNFADAVGLAAAIDYVAPLGMDAVHAHGRDLAVRTIHGLKSIPGVRVFGPPPEEDRGGIVSFLVDDIHAHDVAGVLDREGIAVRAGHHCAMPLHQRLGVPATTRASFTIYNDASEVDRLVEGVKKVKAVFAR
ncbi:MAG TPA: cysteine desulfurase [Candidatus Eisenbacteria bacterium]|nr:cysteine desulfurase [Candidatus Eisenbacteria bacterium]